ncbi:SDR family NAD(P)-dependent oxidoreductase [Brevibacterium oceani]|uniref:SDR family NAD(P)-dependent oxidoreductase n=1 Tax=Brevibacterium oceani TaxID=358099 RepID=UPI0015E71FE9|nr:SDR family oxidoreductase [Brevibacterium oceani]
MTPVDLKTALGDRKLVIVTGASNGIGAACLEKLVTEGYSVLGLDRASSEAGKDSGHSPRATQSSTSVRFDRAPGKSAVFECDVRDYSRMSDIADDLKHAELTVNGIVNVAGVSPTGDVFETTDEEWERTFAVNVGGIRNTTRAFAPLMHRPASIVNVASGAGLRALPQLAAYVASKHAAVGLTKAMALDLAGRNVRVNCVCPGQVDTALARQVQEGRKGESRERAASLSDYMIPRIGLPREIAEPVSFLLSDSASYITGSTVSVDAGRTQH